MKKIIVLLFTLLVFNQNIIITQGLNQNIKKIESYYQATSYIKKKFPQASKDFVLYKAGVLLYNNRKFLKSMKCFQEILYKYSTSKYREKAGIYLTKSYIKLKQYVFAENEIKLYLKRYNKVRRKDLFMLFRGIVANSENQIGKAISYLNEAITHSKTKSIKYQAMHTLAEIYFKIGDRKKSLIIVDKLIKLVPSFKKSWHWRLKYLRSKLKWQYIMNLNPRDKAISSLFYDNKQMFIMTWVHGIAIFDRNRNEIVKRYRREDGLISNLVRSMAVDRNKIWVSTYAGLAIYDTKSKKWEKILSRKAPNDKLKTIVITKK